jgi:selenocysteine-specific elongation factor
VLVAEQSSTSLWWTAQVMPHSSEPSLEVCKGYKVPFFGTPNLVLLFSSHEIFLTRFLVGSSIIDIVILVIDVTKGIQTQTAEGIIIAEVATQNLVILLNKLDLVEESERESRVSLLKTRISKLLANSSFSNIKFVAYAAKPQSGEPIGLEELRKTLSHINIPKRNYTNDSFLMSVDHCFSIKGQGSVATGTLLRGTLQLNQLVEVVGHHGIHKVKSMEVFKQRVKTVSEGQRVGVLLPSLDASLLERGLLAQPGSVSFADGLVVNLRKIRYYKSEIESGSKLHITIGHSTSLAKITLFSDLLSDPIHATSSATLSTTHSDQSWDPNKEYPLIKTLPKESSFAFALLHLERQIPVPQGSIYIASKMDADIHSASCRLAFHGSILATFNAEPSHPATSSSSSNSKSISSVNAATTNLPSIQLESLKIFTTKEKQGSIDRIVDDFVLIGRNLFKKETKMSLFIGLRVQIDGKTGLIDSAFGTSGKFKVRFENPVAKSIPHNAPIVLLLKRYLYDDSKKIRQ